MTKFDIVNKARCLLYFHNGLFKHTSLFTRAETNIPIIRVFVCNLVSGYHFLLANIRIWIFTPWFSKLLL